MSLELSLVLELLWLLLVGLELGGAGDGACGGQESPMWVGLGGGRSATLRFVRLCHWLASVAAADAKCSPKNACNNASWAVAGTYPSSCWRRSSAQGRWMRVPLGVRRPASRTLLGRVCSVGARRVPASAASCCRVARMP